MTSMPNHLLSSDTTCLPLPVSLPSLSGDALSGGKPVDFPNNEHIISCRVEHGENRFTTARLAPREDLLHEHSSGPGFFQPGNHYQGYIAPNWKTFLSLKQLEKNTLSGLLASCQR
jgi:hypothetical protein